MDFSKFYVEPKSSLIFSSPLLLAEISARQCYDSFDYLDFNYEKISDDMYDKIIKFYNDDIYSKDELIKNIVNFNNLSSKDKDIIKNMKKDILKYLFSKYPDVVLNNTNVNVEFIRGLGINKKHESILEHVVLTFKIEYPRNVLQELSRHRIGVSPSVKSTRYTLTELRKMFKNKNSFSDILEYVIKNSGLQDDDINEILTSYLISNLNHFEKIGIDITNDNIKNILPEHWLTSSIHTMSLRAFINLMNLRVGDKVFLPFRKLVLNMFNVLPLDVKELLNGLYNDDIENLKKIWD